MYFQNTSKVPYDYLTGHFVHTEVTNQCELQLFPVTTICPCPTTANLKFNLSAKLPCIHATTPFPYKKQSRSLDRAIQIFH